MGGLCVVPSQRSGGLFKIKSWHWHEDRCLFHTPRAIFSVSFAASHVLSLGSFAIWSCGHLCWARVEPKVSAFLYCLSLRNNCSFPNSILRKWSNNTTMKIEPYTKKKRRWLPLMLPLTTKKVRTPSTYAYCWELLPSKVSYVFFLPL